MARLESVNIGREQNMPRHDRMGRTGIFKVPVSGPARITRLGVEHDCVFDKKHHGGPDQAVYVYFAADYDWWSKELGRTIAPGTFGDNITISGLTSADISIGDRFTIGDAVLEATAPRIPCSTLAARMDDPQFVKLFRDADRPGTYCRVIREGVIAAGTEVAYETFAGDRVAAVEMFRDWFQRKTLTAESLKRTLAAPIAERSRRDWEELLAAVASAA